MTIIYEQSRSIFAITSFRNMRARTPEVESRKLDSLRGKYHIPCHAKRVATLFF